MASVRREVSKSEARNPARLPVPCPSGKMCTSCPAFSVQYVAIGMNHVKGREACILPLYMVLYDGGYPQTGWLVDGVRILSRPPCLHGFF